MPQFRTIVAVNALLLPFASACATSPPPPPMGSLADQNSTKSNTSLATLAQDPASPTGVRLSSERPTDARLCVGWGFGCAITDEDSVRCWGTNNGGELGAGKPSSAARPANVSELHNVTRIACGETNSTGGNACALNKSGELYCWGTLFTGSIPKIVHEPVKMLDHVVDIKTGADRACALSDDGSLRCWGANHRGQLGDGTTNPSEKPIPLPNLGPVYDFGLEGFGGCAIGTDGEVRCWGAGPCPSSPQNAHKARVVPGLRGARWVSSREPLYVVDASGDFVGYHCGSGVRGIELTELMRIHGVARAYDSVDRLCVVRNDDSVHCIERGGLGDQGALLGVALSTKEPVEVPMLRGAKEIALTRFYGCAASDNGLRCFGDNRGGAPGGLGAIDGAWLSARLSPRSIPNAPPPMRSSAAVTMAIADSAPQPPESPEVGAFTCPQSTVPPPAPKTTGLFESIYPFNRGQCLDGTATGLLITSSFGVPALSWSGFAVKLFPAPVYQGNYLFAHGDDGFRALYFAAPGGDNPLDLQVSRGDGKPYMKYSSRFSPQKPNPWKLTNAAHIVRVRVNDGFGSSGGLHFIASDVTILDNTKELPLDPTAVLTGFLEPLASETTPEGQRWRKLVATAITKKLKKDRASQAFAKDVPTLRVLGGFYATWDEKAEELRVGFYASIEETRAHETRNPEPHAGQTWCYAPPGADCAPRHIPATITQSLTQKGEYAVRASFSKTGALVRREELPVVVQ